MTLQSTLGYFRVAIFYYVVGGVTFLPLCIVLFVAWFYLTAPAYRPEKELLEKDLNDPIGDVEFSEQRKREALDLAVSNAEAQNQAEKLKDKEEAIGTSTAPASARRLKPPPPAPVPRPHRSSWLVIRRQFHADAVILAQQAAEAQASASGGGGGGGTEANGAQTTRSADGEKGSGYMSTLYRGMLNYRNSRTAQQIRRKGTDSASVSGSTTPENGQDDGRSEKAGSSSAVNAGAAKQATGTGGRESFYCILKGPVLYLYSSDDTNNSATECHAAIDLRSKRVSLYISGLGDTLGEPEELEEERRLRDALQAGTPYDTESSTMSESEGLKKTRAKIDWRKAKRSAVRDGELFTKRNAVRIVSTAGSKNTLGEKRRFAQWFIFCKSASTLEDWYHALLHASMLPESNSAEVEDPVGPAFSPVDMATLLTSLDTLPDPIPLRWLNALIGRIFFSIYRTSWLEDYVTRKIMKKISRVKTPGFLSDIRVQEVDLGRSPPAFSKPMLKSLTGNGEASMEVAIHYTGSLRLTISTVLTISLGSRFKPYNVPLVLAVIVNSLEGNLLLQVKPPPSNRLWFGFTKLPKMEISVEPVVSERKVQWGMVKKLIEGRIRELLTESLVVPNMDDIPFFDSRPLSHRGGIWADACKRPDDSKSTAATVATSDETPVERKVKSTPVSVLEMSANDAEGTSTSANLGASFASDVKRRGKVSTEGGATTAATVSGTNSPSPAAAGLSTLLARDMARDQTQGEVVDTPRLNTAGPPAASKRMSWFVSRSNASSPPVSQVENKRPNQQSSLAWGSASLSIPKSEETTSGSQSAPVSSIDSTMPHLVFANAHERNKESVSSFGTSASSAASADTEELHSGLMAALQDEQVDPEDEERHRISSNNSVNVPLVTVEGSSSHDSEMTEGGTHENISESKVDIPTNPSPEHQPLDRDTEDTKSTNSVKDSVEVPLSTARRSPVHGFAPPPSRGATVRQRQQEQQDQQRQEHVQSKNFNDRQSSYSSPATAHLTAIQRDRYAPYTRSNKEDDGASMRSTSTNSNSSTALYNTWNKAKASMADKESRQAAAKDAKEALKKGWANWNAKRNGNQSNQIDNIPTSSDQLGETIGESRSRTSSWLESSPPDPASLGMGFDVHEENQSSMPALKLDGTEFGRDDEANPSTENSRSRTSSINARTPYRDHRASKEREVQHESLSKPSSIRSGTSTPPIAQNELNSAWERSMPSVTEPIPVTRRQASNTSTTNQQHRDHLSNSPSSIRKLSMGVVGGSSSNIGASGSGISGPDYSFVPSQGQATTSLSSVDLASHFTDQNLLAKPKPAENNADVLLNEANSPPLRISPLPSISIGKSAEDAKTGSEPLETSFIAASESGTPQRVSSGNTPLPVKSDTQLESSSNTINLASPKVPQPQTGIKQQPTRAAMMAIPGIPSMQKSSPQSFSAAPELAPASTSNNDITSSPRLGLGNLIARMPSFTTSSATSTPGIVAPAADPMGVDGSPKQPEVVATVGSTPAKRRMPPPPPALPSLLPPLAPTMMKNSSPEPEEATTSKEMGSTMEIIK